MEKMNEAVLKAAQAASTHPDFQDWMTRRLAGATPGPYEDAVEWGEIFRRPRGTSDRVVEAWMEEAAFDLVRERENVARVAFLVTCVTKRRGISPPPPEVVRLAEDYAGFSLA